MLVVFSTLFIPVLGVFFGYKLRKPMNEDDRAKFDAKYGSIFAGTKSKTELTTMLLPVIKNLILALVVTWFDKYPVIAIFIIMTSVTVQLAYTLASKPYIENAGMHLFNLLVEFGLSYLLLLMTDYVEDQGKYVYVSNTFIYCTLCLIFWSLGMTLI